VDLLQRLGELLQDDDLRRRARRVLASLAEPMARFGAAFGWMLGVADTAVHGAVEVALVGEPSASDFRALAREVSARYVPSLALAGGAPDRTGDVALLAGRTAREGRATAYVCRDYACDAPVTDPGALAVQLETAVAAGRLDG
jgi:uncharacterized protein YyaL (SSP411 family)